MKGVNEKEGQLPADLEKVLSQLAALETENKMLRDQLQEAKATIAAKDHFIEESVKRFNQVVTNLGVSIQITQSDPAPTPTSEKPALQHNFAELARLISPKRLAAIKMLGDYAEKYPKSKLAVKDWGPTEFAIEMIKSLISAYKVQNVADVMSTDDCLNPLIEQVKKFVTEQNYTTYPRDFERLLLDLTSSSQNDQAPDLVNDDKEALDKHLSVVFGGEGYDIPSVCQGCLDMMSAEKPVYNPRMLG